MKKKMFERICTYVRDFILFEIEADFQYRSEIDWSLEELWTRDFLDDDETVNEFGYRGFITELEKWFAEENNFVERANYFIMSLFQIYYDDDDEEMDKVVRCWNERYRKGFEAQVLDLYFKNKEKVDFLVEQLQKQKI